MADVVDRREARRRKILENSENRLRIISGLTKVDNSEDLVQNVKTDRPEQVLPDVTETKPTPSKCDVFPNTLLQGNDKVFPTEEVKDFQSTSRHDNHITDPVISPMPESMGASLTESGMPKSIVSTLMEARLYLVVLAILVRLLLSFNHGHLFGDSIFVPLFTTKLAKYFGIIPESDRSSGGGGMFNAALLLCGMSSRQLSLINTSLEFIRDFITDFYIYFFTFVLTHVLFEVSVY